MNHGDLLPLSHPHLTNLALSDLTDEPCGRVTSGIREPQLTSGLRKDTQLQESSNVTHAGTCRGRRCGVSLPSGGLIGQTHHSLMVIFPDSQQSLPGILQKGGRSCDGSHQQHLLCKYGAYHRQKHILHCQFCFLTIQHVQGSGPLLCADATICLTRSKISRKWFVSICRPSICSCAMRNESFEMGSNT